MGTSAKALEGETLTLRLYQGLALPGTGEALWPRRPSHSAWQDKTRTGMIEGKTEQQAMQAKS